ncbi:MAG: ion transporter [Pseudomonadota bacterium]
MALRAAIHRQLEPSARDKRGLSWPNAVIVFLVLASFVVLALETEPTLPPGWRTAIEQFNIAIICIFGAEYLIRLWIAGEDPAFRGGIGRLRYMATPYAIADLIAFGPELAVYLFAPSTDAAHILITLRMLRLARLVKIARYMPAFDILSAALSRSWGQLLTTLALAAALVYVSAVMLYFIEGVGQGSEAFASIPRALWWAVATLTTVGYGDVYPTTVLGRIAAAFIALAGIGVVALPAGVFASAFSDELRERERDSKEP